jgi:putative redox protein
VEIGGRTYTITQAMIDDFRSHDLPASIGQLTKPVLIFHSPRDETLGYDHALRIYSLVMNRGDHQPVSPGASLMTLLGSDHLLTNHPADNPFVAETIHAWLKRLSV